MSSVARWYGIGEPNTSKMSDPETTPIARATTMSIGGSPDPTILNSTRTSITSQVARRHFLLNHGAATVTNAAAAATAAEVGNPTLAIQPRLREWLSSRTPSRSLYRDSMIITVNAARFVARNCIPINRNSRRHRSRPNTTTGTMTVMAWPSPITAPRVLLGSRLNQETMSCSNPPTVFRATAARNNPNANSTSPTMNRIRSPDDQR